MEKDGIKTEEVDSWYPAKKLAGELQKEAEFYQEDPQKIEQRDIGLIQASFRPFWRAFRAEEKASENLYKGLTKAQSDIDRRMLDTLGRLERVEDLVGRDIRSELQRIHSPQKSLIKKESSDDLALRIKMFEEVLDRVMRYVDAVQEARCGKRMKDGLYLIKKDG